MENVVTIRDFHIKRENIDKTFEMSRFERRLYPSHVRHLKESIMENGLLKPDISVWENGKYNIIDGQHRLEAIRELLLEGFQQSFSIKLHIYRAKTELEARKLYIEINMSVKALTLTDIVKAYDYGSEFFTLLKEECRHESDLNHISYVSAMQAIKYAMTGNPHSVVRAEVEDWLKSIEFWHVERFKQFLTYIQNEFGRDSNLFVYKSVVFRNIFRIYWENYEAMQSRKWAGFIRRVSHDKFLQDSSRVKTGEAMISVYEYMCRLAKVESHDVET